MTNGIRYSASTFHLLLRGGTEFRSPEIQNWDMESLVEAGLGRVLVSTKITWRGQASIQPIPAKLLAPRLGTSLISPESSQAFFNARRSYQSPDYGVYCVYAGKLRDCLPAEPQLIDTSGSVTAGSPILPLNREAVESITFVRSTNFCCTSRWFGASGQSGL